MDFELDDDLSVVRDLAEKIFADRATVDRVRAVESDLDGYDADLWRTLADAGLLGIHLPIEQGGAGLGLLGLTVLLEQQGRRVAPVPLWNALAGAALPLAAAGSSEHIARWLEPLLTGQKVVVGAFLPDSLGQVRRLTATADGESWRLSGSLAPIAGGGVADAVLVPVELDGEATVCVIPTGREGVGRTPLAVTSRGNAAELVFDDVVLTSEDLLVTADQAGNLSDLALTWTRIALAAVQSGVCREALTQTAQYTSQRHQFGRPLSTNQGVALRAADAHLDTEAIRLSTLRAAWLHDTGERDAVEPAALVATWWASAAGLRAVHATQHLHGGMGADVDYPIHRYFLWGREIAFSLGSAAAVAAELGNLLPYAPAIGSPA